MNVKKMTNDALLQYLLKKRAAAEVANKHKQVAEQEVLVRMGLASWEYTKSGTAKFVERKNKSAQGELRGMDLICKVVRDKKGRAGGIDAQSLIKAGIDIELHKKPRIYPKEWVFVDQKEELFKKAK